MYIEIKHLRHRREKRKNRACTYQVLLAHALHHARNELLSQNAPLIVLSLLSAAKLIKMKAFPHYLFAATLFLPLLDFASAIGLPIVSLSSQEAVIVVEIQQVVDLFAVAVDQHRWDLLSQVFQPDVTADFSIPDSPVLHGLDSVIQLLRRLEAYPSFHSQSSHYVDVSNVHRPHAVTYVTGVFFLGDRIYTNYGR